MVQLYLRMAVVGTLVRCLYFAIPPHVLGTGIVPAQVHRWTRDWWLSIVQTFLYTAANIAFNAMYALILFFWTAAYASLQPLDLRCLTLEFTTYMRFMMGYVAVEGITFLVFFLAPYFIVMGIHSFLLAILSLGIAILFLLLHRLLLNAFGNRTVSASQLSSTLPLALDRAAEPPCSPRKSRRSSSVASSAMPPGRHRRASSASTMGSHSSTRSPAAQQKIRRIQGVAIAYCTCCALHASVLVYEGVTFFQGERKFPHVWWGVILFTYYFVAEIVCTGLVIFILKKPSSEKSRPAASVNQGGLSRTSSTKDGAVMSRHRRLDGSYGSLSSDSFPRKIPSPTRDRSPSDGLGSGGERGEGSSVASHRSRSRGYHHVVLYPNAVTPPAVVIGGTGAGAEEQLLRESREEEYLEEEDDDEGWEDDDGAEVIGLGSPGARRGDATTTTTGWAMFSGDLRTPAFGSPSESSVSSIAAAAAGPPARTGGAGAPLESVEESFESDGLILGSDVEEDR